ncbi:hypothetical protein CPB83DRAFT_864015 [Crepidotus variabilis]|uniref:Uncharacterized protein n=1 Tax=Crepidotus variabilis TaxID=179855 RepID=A0A9P6JJB6_9AGAR|nr:hypothetical protein CPB83DRAFT_864015 [Crepidotus variabilis]
MIRWFNGGLANSYVLPALLEVVDCIHMQLAHCKTGTTEPEIAAGDSYRVSTCLLNELPLFITATFQIFAALFSVQNGSW